MVFRSTHPRVGAAGIEPALTAYKTGALPLDEAPVTGTAGCGHPVDDPALAGAPTEPGGETLNLRPSA